MAGDIPFIPTEINMLWLEIDDALNISWYRGLYPDIALEGPLQVLTKYEIPEYRKIMRVPDNYVVWSCAFCCTKKSAPFKLFRYNGPIIHHD